MLAKVMDSQGITAAKEICKCTGRMAEALPTSEAFSMDVAAYPELFGLAINFFLLVIGIEMRNCNQWNDNINDVTQTLSQLISIKSVRTYFAPLRASSKCTWVLDAQARLLWSEFTLNFVCHVTVSADLHINLGICMWTWILYTVVGFVWPLRLESFASRDG